jgi:quinol monooxygenase YgiN
MAGQRGGGVSVIVVATVPEHHAEVLLALTNTVPWVHAEDGCDIYALHEGPDRLVLIEEWTYDEALAAHATAQPLAHLRSRLGGKMIGDLDTEVDDLVADRQRRAGDALSAAPPGPRSD